MVEHSNEAMREALGTRLAEAAPVMPADMRARVRATIMAGVRTTRVPVLARRRIAVVFAGVCVAASAMSGVTLAAAASLPGDPLHGLKLAWEQSRVALAPTPGLRNAALRAIASDREAEAAALRERGDVTLSAETRAARDEALRALPHLDQALIPRVGASAGMSARLFAHASAAAKSLTASGKGAAPGRGAAGGGSGTGASPKGARSPGAKRGRAQGGSSGAHGSSSMH